jgi:pyruvate dehydrogenase E1 component beta subunit/2-oxoisovalerate dehydrogenase E1 component
MSGGQFPVPVVIRMATGAGRQLAAQHSHSLEAWYAHVPGLRVVEPATIDDARGMLRAALACPDPVIMFEPISLYNMEGDLTAAAADVRLDGARVHRAGGDVTLVTYGASLWRCVAAAEALAGEGIDAEVIDLRSLRPLDDATILASVRRNRRVVIVDEGWRTGSLAAEIGMRIVEQGFYDLDAPVARVCTEEVPIPYPKHLEDAALPNPERIVAAVRRMFGHAQ